MAKQIIVPSSRRLLQLKHRGGGPGHLQEQLASCIQQQQQLRVVSSWSKLCQQLGVGSAGKRFKSAAPPLGVETLDPCQLEDLPIEVINRKKDKLDLTFEVRISAKFTNRKVDAVAACSTDIFMFHFRITVQHLNPRQHGRY